jgi:hypothetical protein
MADNNTQDRGFAAMKKQGREDEVRKIAQKGGQASGASGAAGKTEAAKRGGQHSRRS